MELGRPMLQSKDPIPTMIPHIRAKSYGGDDDANDDSSPGAARSPGRSESSPGAASTGNVDVLLSSSLEKDLIGEPAGIPAPEPPEAWDAQNPAWEPSRPEMVISY